MAKAFRRLLLISASRTEKSGDSTPNASGKTDFGEPQYGVPTVSTRATFAPSSPATKLRIRRPP